jgi:hypothetical protein
MSLKRIFLKTEHIQMSINRYFQNFMDSGVGYPFNVGQLEDGHRDLKCRKARPRRFQLRKPEALMLQSVPPYVDTPGVYKTEVFEKVK